MGHKRSYSLVFESLEINQTVFMFMNLYDKVFNPGLCNGFCFLVQHHVVGRPAHR